MLLRMRLERSGLFVVVGDAGDGARGATVAEETQPDVVVLDLQMPGVDGLAAIPTLQEVAPRSRLVVLSAFPDPYTLADVLKLGVDAYLDKAHAWTELIPTLLAVARQTGLAPA